MVKDEAAAAAKQLEKERAAAEKKAAKERAAAEKKAAKEKKAAEAKAKKEQKEQEKLLKKAKGGSDDSSVSSSGSRKNIFGKDKKKPRADYQAEIDALKEQLAARDRELQTKNQKLHKLENWARSAPVC